VTNSINNLTAHIKAVQGADPASADLAGLQQQLDNAVSQRAALQDVRTQVTAQYLTAANNVRVFQPALPPSRPVQPQPLLYTLEGGVLGLVLAAGLVLLLLSVDDRVRSTHDLEPIGLVTLGTVERAGDPPWRLGTRQRGQTDSSALLTDPHAARLTEDLRHIRTNLGFVSLDKPLGTILVTSPRRGDGKTTTAINLALSLAQAGRRVLLVDADLRQPSVHARLGLDNVRGLSTYLLEGIRGAAPDIPVSRLPAIPELTVLTAGPTPPNPTELLGSEHMPRLLEAALGMEGHPRLAETIVIDASPVLSVADACVLAGHVDGTMLVVDSRHARAGQIFAARDRLLQVNARLLGVVLNQVGHDEERYGYSSSLPGPGVATATAPHAALVRDEEAPVRP
jgi:non-specific protein-tyrosine kinase